MRANSPKQRCHALRNFTKNRYRSKLTDENPSLQLRVATSSVRPNKRWLTQKSSKFHTE